MMTIRICRIKGGNMKKAKLVRDMTIEEIIDYCRIHHCDTCILKMFCEGNAVDGGDDYLDKEVEDF